MYLYHSIPLCYIPSCYIICVCRRRSKTKNFLSIFCRLPPHPPTENLKLRKENFWFLLPRPQGEKRILGASQDLEHFVLKMRKVYCSCKERTRRAESERTI